MYHRGQTNICSINLFMIFWIFLLFWHKWELLLLFLNKLFKKYSCVSLCCEGLQLHLSSCLSEFSSRWGSVFLMGTGQQMLLCQQKQGFLCSKQFPLLVLQASLKDFCQKSKGLIWRHGKSVSRINGENVCLQERIYIRNVFDVIVRLKEVTYICKYLPPSNIGSAACGFGDLAD